MSDSEEEYYTYCSVCGNKVTVMSCGCEEMCNVCRLADEVIKGEHGNGQARRDSLGDDYVDVQNEVNRRLGYSKRYYK